MRKLMLALALVAASFGVAACGSDDDEDAARNATTAVTDTAGVQETIEGAISTAEEKLDEALTRDLHEQNGSGITGTVKLEPISQDQVKVTIELDGADDAASYPAHVHTGTCANLNPNPEYSLKNVEGSRSETTIDASPLDLFSDDYAVNVHDPEDVKTYVACTDIPSANG